MNKTLIIHTDGGARGNPGPAGIGVTIQDDSGAMLGQYQDYIGQATNNVAEYRALILALNKASAIGSQPSALKILMDSELIVRQMRGQYKIKEPTLKLLAQEVLNLCKKFSAVEFQHVPREQNKLADRLVNQAIDKALGI